MFSEIGGKISNEFYAKFKAAILERREFLFIDTLSTGVLAIVSNDGFCRMQNNLNIMGASGDIVSDDELFNILQERENLIERFGLPQAQRMEVMDMAVRSDIIPRAFGRSDRAKLNFFIFLNIHYIRLAFLEKDKIADLRMP